MEIVMFILDLFNESFKFLLDYLFFPAGDGQFSIMRILSLFIAFSISGAIIVFMSQKAILKNFGPKANKTKSFLVASVSGAVLAVCSCSVLPMFASIRKKGAGLGAAVAFLFSGPAINVLALSFTFSDLGFDIAIARLIGAVVLAIVIGFLMMVLYQKKERINGNEKIFEITEEEIEVKKTHKILFFLTLFAILIFGVYQPLPTIFFGILLMIQLKLFFKKEHIKEWMIETFGLFKKIFPLFLIGIFIAGMIQVLISEDMLTAFVGDNTIYSNLIASSIGAITYFATLTEIPILRSLLDLGMHKGPATTLLLAGPSLSIPNMIVITKVLGVKKAFTYIFMVVIFSSIVGLIAGFIYYI